MQLLQAALEIPDSLFTATTATATMIVQSSYTAFTQLYLSQGHLSAAAAQSCLLHAGVLGAALRSHVEAVCSCFIQLRILEFLVSNGCRRSADVMELAVSDRNMLSLLRLVLMQAYLAFSMLQ